MTETKTTKKKTEYQYPVNEYNEYNKSRSEPTGQEYDKYGAPEYEYDEYELTVEDIILKELNSRYSKKGACVVLASGVPQPRTSPRGVFVVEFSTISGFCG